MHYKGDKTKYLAIGDGLDCQCDTFTDAWIDSRAEHHGRQY